MKNPDFASSCKTRKPLGHIKCVRHIRSQPTKENKLARGRAKAEQTLAKQRQEATANHLVTIDYTLVSHIYTNPESLRYISEDEFSHLKKKAKKIKETRCCETKRAGEYDKQLHRHHKKYKKCPLTPFS